MIQFVAFVRLPLIDATWHKEVTLFGPRGLWFWRATNREPNVVIDLSGDESDDTRENELEEE